MLNYTPRGILLPQKSEALYPICCDFPCWKFPHAHLPPGWENELPNQTTGVWPSNWTAISEKVKTRDTRCLIGIAGLPYYFPCCCQD
ncbi:hypothetical protein F5887DRAFT_912378 [Amanita rubescens]|nr:hypothetical protein F5887DRAFT_912378 [Amanita rubescens]